MLALALLTGPFVTLPTPVFGGEPTLMALARDRPTCAVQLEAGNTA